MSTFDELPPDQRAALSLLLAQRKSYGELAQVLGISERAVHDRAHAALAVLAPRQARDVPAERREEIGDYLLGQQRGVAERMATRNYLGGDEPARTWAQQLAGELAPLGTSLPDIPAQASGGNHASPSHGAQAVPASEASARPPEASAQPPEAAAKPPAPPGPAPAAPPRRTPSSPLPSSRLGGAVLLGGIVAVVVVAVILLSGGGGGGSHAKSTSASSTAASTTGAKASGSGPKVDQRLTLRATSAGSQAIAAVEILSEGGKRAFYMAAEHLPPSKGFYYAIWLYNSASSFKPLSRSPAVGSNERLAGGALLPADAGNYHEMLVTRETAAKPSHPGPAVLRGAFSLGG